MNRSNPTSPAFSIQSLSAPIACVLALGLLLSCDGPTSEGELAYSVETVSGGEQLGSAGMPLPDSVVVRVTDQHGRPAQARVRWVPAAGSGAATPEWVVPDADGMARAQWTLGPATGAQSLAVSVVPAYGVLRPVATATARPTLTAVGPHRAVVGDAMATLTLEGLGFSESSVVLWEDTQLPTTFVSATNLTAAIPGELLSEAGTVEIRVQDPEVPEPSEPVPFEVRAPIVPSAATGSGVISAGLATSCAVAENGTAYCWGSNQSRQLGSDVGARALTPVVVDGGGGYIRIATSGTLSSHVGEFTCGLDGGGSAICWGAGEDGQLGTGGRPRFSGPQPVAGGHAFTAIEAGQSHACALAPDGEVFCWGRYCTAANDCDFPAAEAILEPALVEWPDPFVAVTSGGGGACALTHAGDPVCWGQDPSRQVRDPALADTRAYVALSRGLTRTCGITAAGRTYCWDDAAPAPVEVAGAPDFTAITVGGTHACGLTAQGDAYCWGDNGRGQLGSVPIGGNTPVPRRVDGPAFAAIDAGFTHSCAVALDGTGYCWGDRYHGRLGDGVSEARPVPAPVAGGHRFVQLSGSCGLDSDGTAWCWGSQPDAPDGSYRRTPERVDAGEPLATIAFATGGGYSVPGGPAPPRLCALTADAELHCTRAGGGPVLDRVPTATTPTALVAGLMHHCMLDEAGKAYCWGSSNTWGQFGDGLTRNGEPSDVPIEVRGDLTFTTLAAGDYHTCGRTSDGAAHCWGLNYLGNLGAGKGDEYCPVYQGGVHCNRTPVEVSGAHAFQRLFADGSMSCGQTAAGEVLCWGGTPFATDVCGGYFGSDPCALEPIPVLEDLSVAEVTAACARTTDGRAYCWGDNSLGQLGNGTFETSPHPTPVAGGHTFTAIGSFGLGRVVRLLQHNTCALAADGSAYCWGSNIEGQLGDGVLLHDPLPAPLPGLSLRRP